jgi:arylsulfatase A-like enzyme
MNPKTSLTPLMLAALWLAPATGHVTAAQPPVQPNIVFIMADDLGWRDIGCYGSPYHLTPHLDKLAARSLKFTQAYAANPLCSPTRASVITGLAPARIGITAPGCHLPEVVLEKGLAEGNPRQPVIPAASLTRLDTTYRTLPAILRDAGYRTGHFGKWHLGPVPYSPLEHGFDVDWPHWPGPGPGGAFVAPWAPAFPAKSEPGDHIEDMTADHAVAFIEANKDRPFFVNYWQFSVHTPIDAKKDLVAKHEKRLDPASPQRNPVYAAMIESMDDGVGRVLAALEENQLMEKTIVVFYSDNGGVSWDLHRGQPPHKDGRFPAHVSVHPTSNLPLRNGKASVYEGGVRVPCLVWWPGVTQPGATSDAIIQSIDWLPTLLEMAGIRMPPSVKPDGISIVPALKGGTLERDTIFCHFPHDTPAAGQRPASTVRKGDWKLVRLYALNADGSDQFELYNLRDDVGETRNLAAEQPERVRELNGLLNRFLKDTQAVIPVRNPSYKPAPVPPARKAADAFTPAAPDAKTARPNIIVFFTDDHGYADLGCQGVVEDIKTPRVDALAASGVRMLHGYSTAPQCVPSRGGLLTGRFQSRFGLEDNGSSLDGFNRQSTIAARLQAAGYVTAQFGKWHLGPAAEITRHGFKHVFAQNASAPFSANITVDGHDRPMGTMGQEFYHIDACSRAAAAVIERYHDQPFFLYVAYRAPHVPLDPPKAYLDRFPGTMPERRRKALAMLSAVDDGVGRIHDTLEKHGLVEKTLIFYLSDNGAPLKIHKLDEPGGGAGWDGSLNDPLNGEKGMLTEGGIHVPFIVSWPGTIPGGKVYPHPVTALDVAATAAALAGVPVTTDLDGVNLVPHLRGEIKLPPHEALYWRWAAQSAIREGKWKLLRGGEREYLFDLDADLQEKHNLATEHPEIVERLRARLQAWCAQLQPPGLATAPMNRAWNRYYDHYLDGKTARPGSDAQADAAPDPSTPRLMLRRVAPVGEENSRSRGPAAARTQGGRRP